ncbi:hypothetical protein PJK45_24555 [Mycobacterium kansasii]|uniref:Transposase B domain protein n=3 Tax=Mycobacterium kansasii TaxID=1768 RepID=A0A1V3XQ80_MYCKA|nr:hypothetical protein [Mycobacterium kansasii]EUA01226.1 transposase B domain protein [Mycobacterium kansasii 824]AGZ54040.1 hypothetical protein MKAN_05675 [Mycobacterium kansasii ATCC 12478]EUA20080.1 transposase B domain protein [Mycobacterium kansasii 662]KEP40199.1 hypothetical protein MKSMC1_46190 [Mycobacterium kansasii]OOK78197.1 transposase B domain protein [Mycobacterium kansasii]
MNFEFDSTINGNVIKGRLVIDEHTRQSLLNIVERSTTTERLITELDQLFTAAGGPR